MADLEGKVAIVTGSSRGIGYAIARALARKGAHVVVSSRSPAKVQEATRTLDGAGPATVLGVPCDVRDPEACARLVAETVQRFGRLDILVNNAGLGIFQSLLETSNEDFDLQLQTNLSGVFYCAKAAAPHLIDSGDGWIINIGSLAGRNAFAGGVAYNASKFGLIGMTEAMMLDLRHRSVRVSLVMPGSVDTEFSGPGKADRPWALTADDVAQAVLGLLDYPPNAHVSRIEMRPSKPVKA